MKWLRLLLRLSLGGLFLVLSLDKIRYPLVFAEALKAYELVPEIFLPVLVLILPWLEFTAGLFLILGLLQRGTSLVLALLSLSFTLLVGITLARGLDIQCGCFTHETLARVSWKHLLFDLLLLSSALSIYRWGPGPFALDLLLLGPKEKPSNPTQRDS